MLQIWKGQKLSSAKKPSRSGPTLTDEQRLKSGRGPRITYRPSLQAWAKLSDIATNSDMSRSDALDELVLSAPDQIEKKHTLRK